MPISAIRHQRTFTITVSKVSNDGYIADYAVTKASVHDVNEVLKLMLNARVKNKCLLGDEGYISKEVQEKLDQMGYKLWTPYRRNMKDSRPYNRREYDEQLKATFQF